MGNKENKMFCFQCQETAGCSGCTVSGVCGKKPDVAAMQDLLVYVTKGLSAVTTELRFDGKEIEAYVNEMIIVNLFTTITNANFDKDSIIERIKNTLVTKEELIRKIEKYFRKQHSGKERKRILKQKLLAWEFFLQRMKISAAFVN